MGTPGFQEHFACSKPSHRRRVEMLQIHRIHIARNQGCRNGNLALVPNISSSDTEFLQPLKLEQLKMNVSELPLQEWGAECS